MESPSIQWLKTENFGIVLFLLFTFTPHIQLSKSNLEYLLNASVFSISMTIFRLRPPSSLISVATTSPYWSHLSVLQPFFTLQLSHVISLIISQGVYITFQLTKRLFTATNRALCDVHSARLSSLVPCSVPYTLGAPLKQLLPVPPGGTVFACVPLSWKLLSRLLPHLSISPPPESASGSVSLLLAACPLFFPLYLLCRHTCSLLYTHLLVCHCLPRP